jgi:hypothetical protein
VKADDDDDDDDDAHDTLVARASGFNPVSSSTYRRLSRTLDRDNVCRSGASSSSSTVEFESSSCRVIFFLKFSTVQTHEHQMCEAKTTVDARRGGKTRRDAWDERSSCDDGRR